MNKAKVIACAIAALGSASASAAMLPASGCAVAADCQPEVVLYIVGASAQKPGVQTIIPTATFFDTGTTALATIKSKLTKDTTNYSNPLNFPQGSQGWYGIGATGSGADGQRLLVLISTANGSGGGVNQVISTGTPTEPEANVVFVGNDMNCVADGTTGYKCDYKAVEADVALSDTYVGELSGIVGDPSGLTEVRAQGMQGFGVIASPNLYRALQEQNVADGQLSSTCTTGATDTTAACQPSITRTAYFNVAAQAGTKHTVAGLVPNATLPVGTNKLQLYRRVATSGTQASSGIYFLNKPCGDLAGYSYAPNGAASTTTYEVVLGSQSDDVIDGVKAATGNNFALGVVSLEKSDSSISPARWVKLNGVSPNYDAFGAADSTHRKALLDGRYEFQMEMAAYYAGTPLAGGLLDLFLQKLQDPTLSNNTGYAYQQGTFTAGKSTKLGRGTLGNCDTVQ